MILHEVFIWCNTVVQYSKCNIIPQALWYLLYLSDSSVRWVSFWQTRESYIKEIMECGVFSTLTTKEQYHLMQLTYAFKTIIFLAPLIAGKTTGAELPIILAEESSWLLHAHIFYSRFQLRHTMASGGFFHL